MSQDIQYFHQKNRAELGADKQKVMFMMNKVGGLSYEDMQEILKLMFEEVLRNITPKVVRFIATYVPKASGQLRESLISNFHSSSVLQTGAHLSIKFGTNLDYVRYVNDMPSSQLQHSGQVGYVYNNFHKGRVILNDPKAQHGFFQLAILFMRDEMRKEWKNVYQNYTALAGVSAKPFSTIKVQTK